MATERSADGGALKASTGDIEAGVYCEGQSWSYKASQKHLHSLYKSMFKHIQ